MKALWIAVPLAGLVVAGCGSATEAGGGLPTVAASPAETPTPPATAPPPATAAPVTATAAPARTTAAPATTAAPIVPGQGQGSTGSTCQNLKLALATGKSTYSPGETVTMTATLTNAGSTTCTFSSGADHGFTVEAGGASIWVGGCQSTAKGHASAGFCAQYEMLQTVRPGQLLTRSQDWAQQRDAGSAGPVAAVPAGSYTATEAWGGQRATTGFTIG